MNTDKQMVADLIEIFDEEYYERRLITPKNTADKLTAKGYRKASEVAEEIFGELEAIFNSDGFHYFIAEPIFDELKKKYTEGEG